MALMHGADIVFALPVCWAVRDAEHFALGGVRLLQLLGAEAISFGAETADPTLLTQAACLSESTAVSAALQTALGTGLPYPAALQQAVADGTLTEERVNESVYRILLLKCRFGIVTE